MSENYNEILNELKEQNSNILATGVIDANGAVIFSIGEWNLESDAKNSIETWLNHGPRIEIEGTGYSVLRSEPELLVAKNVAGKGSIVGSITKGGNYLIAKLPPVSTERVGKDSIDVARTAAKLK